jgi:hypothetical protein
MISVIDPTLKPTELAPAPTTQAPVPTPQAAPALTPSWSLAKLDVEPSKNQLVLAGRRIAIELANRDGSVTSTKVLAEMRVRGYEVDSAEKRFMGAVFRKGWTRIGYEPTGSHNRPMSIWTRKV